jgi:deazaflavin-dependent oxidoreductase (nitroreductase family)
MRIGYTEMMIKDTTILTNVPENIDFLNKKTASVTDIQMQQWFPYPQGFVRWLVRAPLFAYRLGMGNILNAAHLMVLTTRGRKSGQPRHTSIEYRRHGKKVYLISAWGVHPQWYQNILAEPHVTVQLGDKTFSAHGRQVTDTAEALRALYLFRRIAPARYDAVMGRIIDADVNARTLPDYSGQFTILRLDLAADPPPLVGLQANLAWLLPVWLLTALIGAILFGVTKLRRSA